MSNIWTFSPSSEVYLKRFLDSVEPPTEENKWIKKFKKAIQNTKNNIESSCENILDDVVDITKEDKVELESKKSEILDCEVINVNTNTIHTCGEEADKTILEAVETDPVEKFTDIYNALLNSPQLFTKIAETLSLTVINKLILHTLEQRDLKASFVDNLYKICIPSLLQRENSWITQDLLAKSYKNDKNLFQKHILYAMLTFQDITNKHLQNFIETLKEEEKQVFLTKILETDLTSEQFKSHLFTILSLYKSCKKTHSIQNNLQRTLIEHSVCCNKENNFGKLLLAFLQEQKNNYSIKDVEKLEKCVETHQTAFKKPCLNIFKQLIKI